MHYERKDFTVDASLTIVNIITVQLQHSMVVFMSIHPMVTYVVSDNSSCAVRRGKNEFKYHYNDTIIEAWPTVKMLPNQLKANDQLRHTVNSLQRTSTLQMCITIYRRDVSVTAH